MARRAWLPGGPRRVRDGYLVPPGARLPALRGTGPPLTVGHGAKVSRIRHDGTVTVCAAAQVGRIDAGHVIVGARARIGRIGCEGNVFVQAGAVVGRIAAGGDVSLLGDCHVDRLRALGDVFIVGRPRIADMAHQGRLTTRAW